ncbi:hypothetical protein HDV06_001341 [Boothiomyces sp. JEL0866]|nr:hypothetical protein HDV06_001337 [Boothiomyces sp. JEL0866]KAJ3317651.1 hypothetical protein HDV06_001341 [Boothiomyces sp. JEL0866]
MRIFQRAFSSIIDNIPKQSYTDAFQSAINTTKDKLAFNFITPKRIVQPTNSFTVSITANRNNTLCFLFDKQGKAICWASAGTVGLKKANRGTSDAGYQACLSMIEKAQEKVGNIKTQGVCIRFKGFGPGRDQAYRALVANEWKINRLVDVTPIRHGGCRPKKKRRI